MRLRNPTYSPDYPFSNNYTYVCMYTNGHDHNIFVLH